MNKEISKRLLLFCVTISVGVLFLEFFVRAFVPITYNDNMYHPDFHHTFMHNIKRTKYYPFYETLLITNSKGFRGPDFPYEKSPETKRILVLGDSVTANVAAPDEAMYTTILQKRLRENSRQNWEVINRGIEGWGTDNEYSYLVKEGYKYQPDIVILEFTVGNDFLDVFLKNISMLQNNTLVFQERFEPLPRGARAKLFLNQHSGVYNLLVDFYHAYIKDQRFEPQQFMTEGYTSEFYESVNETIAIIKLMKEFVHAQNSLFFVIIYSDPRQVSEEQYDFWNRLHKNYLPRDQLMRPNELLREFFDKEGISYLETTSFINTLEDYPAPIDGHLSISGSKKVGDALAQALQEKFKQELFVHTRQE